MGLTTLIAVQPLFQAAIGYALACFRLRQCAAAGASAFEFLCRATPPESAPALFEALLPALHPLLQSTGKTSHPPFAQQLCSPACNRSPCFLQDTSNPDVTYRSGAQEDVGVKPLSSLQLRC